MRESQNQRAKLSGRRAGRWFFGKSQRTGSSEASGVAKLAEVVRYLRDTSNITLLICDSMNGNILVSSMKDIQVMKDRVSQYIVGRNAPHRKSLKSMKII